MYSSGFTWICTNLQWLSLGSVSLESVCQEYSFVKNHSFLLWDHPWTRISKRIFDIVWINCLDCCRLNKHAAECIQCKLFKVFMIVWQRLGPLDTIKTKDCFCSWLFLPYLHCNSGCVTILPIYLTVRKFRNCVDSCQYCQRIHFWNAMYLKEGCN